MTNIVERVAISQSEFDGRPWMSMPKSERDRYMDRARAAIKAMQVPDSRMIEAGDRSMPEGVIFSLEPGEGVDDYDSNPVWSSMINAALEEAP